MMLKTNNLQDILYTFIGDDKNVTINIFYLYKLNLTPCVETQLMFNEATQNNYKISFGEYYTERRLISDMIVQIDISSTQRVNSPKHSICAHQIKDRIDSPNKNKNNAIFDHLNLRKYYAEIDGQRYPRDILIINYGENDYIEQYKNLKLFFKGYIGETILNPFISYTDMETKYSIGIIDLRHQSDHTTPKKSSVS